MEQFKITIIIPTFNRGDLISDTIKSVINQSHQLWELIIVDDGSKDDTEAIVRNFSLFDSRIIYAQRPYNMLKGANACRNYGLKISTGDYIKWLDSDDVLEKDCLQLQLAEIRESKSNVNICNAQFFESENGKVNLIDRLWSKKLISENITNDLVLGDLKWQTACGLWKKSIFDNNPFDERIQNSQEWLFNIKLSLTPAFRISILNKNLVFIRAHSGSMSNSDNKSGKYYFNAALARFYAYKLIRTANLNRSTSLHLIKRFFLYQTFTLYKGYLLGFLKLISYWPKFLSLK